MKKTFWSLALMSIIAQTFFLSGGGYLAYMVITYPFSEATIVSSIGALLFLTMGFAYTFYKVKFLENGIKVFATIHFVVPQHRVFIEYSKIQELRMVWVHKDSKKRKIPSKGLSVPPLYLCFVLGKRKHEWVYVSTFSNKQIDKMLEIIKEKTGLNYEYDRKHKKLIDLNPKETEEQTNN